MVVSGRKYGNKRVEIDGYTFDSKAEARFYEELRLRERAGEVAEIEVHPRFDLWVGDTKIATYVADFRYYNLMLGRPDVVDVKGVRTAVYRLKKRLMLACLGIDVAEVSA